MTRYECVICGNNELKHVETLPNMPVYMGTTKSNDSEYRDMVYSTCSKCGCLQLTSLIPLDILYNDNHNKSVVGQTWLNHNKEFMQYVREQKRGANERIYIGNILEIGDPSYKMVTASEGMFDFNKWYIVEPNPPTEYPDKVEYLPYIFDRNFNVDILKDNNIDTVILSHSLEHMYYPKEILDLIYRSTLDHMHMYISIPDFDHITLNNMMPPCGMHFEHTYYANYHYIQMLLNRCGFVVTDKYNYNDHSIFIKCEKLLHKNKFIGHILSDNICQYRRTVSNINGMIRDHKGPVYLYGAHYPAQLLISLGLNIDVDGILDNDPHKQNNRLYGTDLIVYPSEHIKDMDNVMVICEMGPYTNEIVNNLKIINPKVNIA